MISVILDTNVLIDAERGTGSYQQRIMALILDKKIKAVATRAVVRENVLIVEKIINDRYLKKQINQYLNLVSIVEPVAVNISLANKQDVKLLQAAIAGGVDFLITEDRHLLDVANYQAVRIVRPIEFWQLWESGQDDNGDSWKNWAKTILGK